MPLHMSARTAKQVHLPDPIDFCAVTHLRQARPMTIASQLTVLVMSLQISTCLQVASIIEQDAKRVIIQHRAGRFG